MTITAKRLPLKYKFKYFIADLTEAEKIQLRDEICTEAGISQDRYYRILKIRQGDKKDITFGEALAFASSLLIPITELLTNTNHE